MRALVWVMLAVPFLLAGQAAAAPEFPILDAYLEQFDLADGVPHCMREPGAIFVHPAGQEVDLAMGTNSLLREHLEWHREHEPHGGEQRLPGPEDQFGIVFFDYHRQLITEYDAWRIAQGHEPVAPWDPANPIPYDFDYEPTPNTCVPRNDPYEPVQLPTWATPEGGVEADPLYGNTELCAFEDLNQFGKALTSGFHGSIHMAIGGDMLDTPLRDPLFWASHRWLMDIQDSYVSSCANAQKSGVGPAPEFVAAAPGLGGPALIVGISLAASWTQRRHSTQRSSNKSFNPTPREPAFGGTRAG